MHPASQRDLCNAYRCYQMIKSDDFANQAINYSTAGHPLGLVAEREIVALFLANYIIFYQLRIIKLIHQLIVLKLAELI